MHNQIYLYGASGHGKVVKDLATINNLNVVAYLDDKPKTDSLHGVPILHSTAVSSLINEKFVISIGNNKVRKNDKLRRMDQICDPQSP